LKKQIEIPKKLTKEFILNNLMTKNKDRFNTNLFKHIEISKEYNWCNNVSEYLYCILLEYKSQPKCKKENCNNPVKYNPTQETKYNSYCCPSCSTSSIETQKKLRKTNKEKFGVEYASQSKEIKEKIKETNKERFGVECTLLNEKIKKKKEETNLVKYGEKEVFKSKEIQGKIRETNLKKYGVHTTLLSKEVKEKRRKSIKEKYGVEYNTQKDIKNIEISYKSVSKMEKKINEEFNNIFEEKNKKIISIENKKLEIDLYSKEKQIGIEYNGLMYHSFGYDNHSVFNNREIENDYFVSEYQNKDKHLLKTKLCEEKNIQLFHIFENEWLEEEKKKIWLSMLKNKINIETKRIYARKCTIEILNDKEKNITLTNKQIKENNKIVKDFENKNHLQGNRVSSIKIGLFYEIEGKKELISLMTFGISRYNKNYEYELIRFCTKIGYQVIGGASKLLKHFERQYKPKSLISYANRRWSNGNLYKKIGFKYVNETSPNFFYFDNSRELKSREMYQKHKQREMYNKGILKTFDENKTGQENMYLNGFRRIYDSGNLVFVKKYL